MLDIFGKKSKEPIPVLQPNSDHSKRRLTDRYWTVLFIIAIIVWKQFAPHAIVQKNICDTDSDVNTTTTANDTSDDFKEKEFNTTKYTDDFLDDIYNSKGGSIVIGVIIFLSVGSITHSLSTMKKSRIYNQQLYSMGVIIMSGPLLGRSFSWLVMSSPRDNITIFYLIMNIVSWCIIEVICFHILSMKKLFKVSSERKESKGEVPVIYMKDFFAGPFISFLSILYSTLFMFISLMGTEWNSELSCIINILAMYYVLCVFYYFSLMVSSCMVPISFDEQKVSFKGICRAYFIVARYHFGTVCYHATLILPRIHATFVMNKVEKASKLSTFDRLHLTHWKVHDISTTMTAVYGYNHSRSIKELLELYTSNSSNLKNLQNYSHIFRRCSAISIAVTILMNIWMWGHGVIIEPRIMIGIWFGFIGLFFLYLFIRLFDSVSDAIGLLHDGNTIVRD